MYGKNVVAKASHHDDGRLNVNSIWYTIQGEGPDAGRPAVFIRLRGCNLRCYFCDTEFDTGQERSLKYVSEMIQFLTKGKVVGQPRGLVVITGGEPLLQNILPLVEWCNSNGFDVSVETAGSVYLEGLERAFASDRSKYGNLLVCSPKTPTLSPNLIPLLGALKYIIRTEEIDERDGLPSVSTQVQGKPTRIYRPCANLGPSIPIYLQPMDELDTARKRANASLAAEMCMQHGYRLSVQIHKMVGLD